VRLYARSEVAGPSDVDGQHHAWPGRTARHTLTLFCEQCSGTQFLATAHSAGGDRAAYQINIKLPPDEQTLRAGCLETTPCGVKLSL